MKLPNNPIDMIKSLGEMPERYREYDSERFAYKNLRFVNVKNYDILYTVNNQEKQGAKCSLLKVIIYRTISHLLAPSRTL